jgi:hypothetical protein
LVAALDFESAALVAALDAAPQIQSGDQRRIPKKLAAKRHIFYSVRP